ncbi:protease SohB [[Haemophilus] felis]|nr:protease SohB [[Haemophilus] felis]
MWSDIAIGYGVFVLELVTLLLVVGVFVAVIVSVKQQKGKSQGVLEITDLNERYEENYKKLRDFHLSEEALKQVEKAERKAEKARKKAEKAKAKKQSAESSCAEGQEVDRKARLYVLSFNGDINASDTASLREEINAIVSVATPQDEVLLCLESPGGVVHGYGLAASQLARLKQRGIKLTVAVDKVAASGGYMMACVADKIVAAPFAILGSIGVVAQVPNIHRLLKKHDVDVDVMTAGEYKRTVTLLGENTEKGKQKFQQELDETHGLFKQFVAQYRPHLVLDKVATGEHWFGQQALDLHLIDEIATSDEVILSELQKKDVLMVKYHFKKSLLKKMGKQMEESVQAILLKCLKGNQRTLL